MTVPRSGIERPAWLTANTRQLAVLVRDRSPSMRGQKAQDASQACRELVEELASPANRDAFDVAVVDFSGSAELVNDVTKASSLASTIEAVKPHGGGTNLTAGMQVASHVVQGMESSEESRLRPIVILFTDGCHNSGEHPGTITEKLKQSCDVVTVAFGEDANSDLLKQLATSPQHHYCCRNGAELRMFFAAVGRTMTVSLQGNQNATQALGEISIQ